MYTTGQNCETTCFLMITLTLSGAVGQLHEEKSRSEEYG